MFKCQPEIWLKNQFLGSLNDVFLGDSKDEVKLRSVVPKNGETLSRVLEIGKGIHLTTKQAWSTKSSLMSVKDDLSSEKAFHWTRAWKAIFCILWPKNIFIPNLVVSR